MEEPTSPGENDPTASRVSASVTFAEVHDENVIEKYDDECREAEANMNEASFEGLNLGMLVELKGKLGARRKQSEETPSDKEVQNDVNTRADEDPNKNIGDARKKSVPSMLLDEAFNVLEMELSHSEAEVETSKTDNGITEVETQSSGKNTPDEPSPRERKETLKNNFLKDLNRKLSVRKQSIDIPIISLQTKDEKLSLPDVDGSDEFFYLKSDLLPSVKRARGPKGRKPPSKVK